MRRGASGARRMCVYLRMGRGRYQNSPTAVPRSSLTPDWTGEPHADDFSSIAPAYEGYVWRRSRVCKHRLTTPDATVQAAGGGRSPRAIRAIERPHVGLGEAIVQVGDLVGLA